MKNKTGIRYTEEEKATVVERMMQSRKLLMRAVKERKPILKVDEHELEKNSSLSIRD